MAKLKLKRNQILRIERDDVNARNSIKSSLTQSQEKLALKQSEIATNNMFDDNIKVIDNLLSNLRNATHDVATAPINKEQIFRLALIDYDIINRINECNIKMLSQAEDLLKSIKAEEEFNNLKEKINELRDSFSERQKLYSSANIFL